MIRNPYRYRAHMFWAGAAVMLLVMILMGGSEMSDREDRGFVERVEAANRQRFEGRPTFAIGDHVPAEMIEGIWSNQGRIIIDTSSDPVDPEVPLIDESYCISAPDRAWYAVFVAPTSAGKYRARNFLGRHGFASYWPRRVYMAIRGRGKKRKAVPKVQALFPRYLVAHLPARWTSVGVSKDGAAIMMPVDAPVGVLSSPEARFNDVAGPVKMAGKPVFIPDVIVERIIDRERKGEFNETSRRRKKRFVTKRPDWLFEGALVRVKSGPFGSFPGAVEEIDEFDRWVKVAVAIFGRATPVELSIADIEELC